MKSIKSIMKSIFNKLFVFILICGVMVSYSSISYGWTHNEHQINNTGQTAFDVVKILDGAYTITDMMDWDFHQHDYYHVVVGGKKLTVLRWWDGTVENGTAGDVCFTAKNPDETLAYNAKIIGAWWTGKNGRPIGDYYPAVSSSVDFSEIGNCAFKPVVNLGNFQAAKIEPIEPTDNNSDFWKNGGFRLTGEAAPIFIKSVKAAIVDKAFTPATLTIENTINNRLLADSFFDVFVNQLSPIPYNGIIREEGFPDILPGQSLVVVVDQGNGNYDLFNFEAPAEIPPYWYCCKNILGAISTLNVAIGSIEAKNDKMETKLDYQARAIKAIEAKNDKMEVKLDGLGKLPEAVTAIEIKNDKMEVKLDRLGKLPEAVSKIEAKNDKMEVKLDGLGKAVSKIEAKNDKMETKLDGLGRAVAVIEAKNDKMEAKLDRLGKLEGRINDLVTMLKNLQASVDKLEAKLDKPKK